MVNLTPVVRSLLLLNIILFILQAIAPAMEFASCMGNYQVGLPLDVVTGYLSMWDVRTECFKPYQLFTYMFLHGDFGHILFNMLGLVFFGPILETYWGSKRFTLFYMATGIGAAVIYIGLTVFTGGHPGHMLGASGAIYGIMTAVGIIFPNMEMRLLFLPIAFRVKYLVLVLGMIAIYSGFTGRGDGTAHFAHLGGILIAIVIIQVWRSRGTY